MVKDKKRLIVIDGNAIVHRAYHALPPLINKKRELVNAVYGFLSFFFKSIKELKPDFIVATFDTPGPTFRHKEYKDYKATREKTPEDLSSQLPKVKEVLKNLGVQVLERQGYEADDIIGTIAKECPEEVETIIVTGDLDILQLVDKSTKVYALRKGVKDTVLYDEKKVKERYDGLSPKQLVDFRALRGDASDNIPGVLGVGEKTAIKLLKDFHSLDNLYKEIEKDTKKAQEIKSVLKNKLLDSKQKAFLSQKLAKIDKESTDGFNLEKCSWKGYNKEKVMSILKSYGFKSLIKRFSESENKDYNKEKIQKPIKKKETKSNLRLL